MKAYKIEVFIIDFEDVGPRGIHSELENCKHIGVQIKDTKVTDIGEWSEDHPLNKGETYREAYQHLTWKQS